MPSLTPAQQRLRDALHERYPVVRPLALPDGSIILFLATSEGTPLGRLHVDQRGGAAPATPAQIKAAHDLATAHVRRPCPNCGYPARRPRCASCGKVIPTTEER